ncbi:MAG: aldo/keto reductase [Oscillospiraceae bacterium]
MAYLADDKRYEKMPYRRCGRSGLKVSAISLGLWQNFGLKNSFENSEAMCRTAFDLGINHFDLANNYGNPYNGSAEETFARILARGLGAYRDELTITTKAGYDMWAGPYGAKGGSRKYLLASLDQSLKRLGLDYVDVFYHHVADPETPAEETALALDHAVKQGKALYVGISNYNRAQTAEILAIFRELKTPFVLNQPMYSMRNRWIEHDKLAELAAQEGFAFAAYCPLHQGILTERYLNGIPADSRAAASDWLRRELDDAGLARLQTLNIIAAQRGQTLPQLALAWVLRKPEVATVLIGASRPEQIIENVKAVERLDFTAQELAQIEAALAE